MNGVQDDPIFAELGNLGGEFEIPRSPAERERERERSSRSERERAHMKWKFSVYSLMARRLRESLRDVQMTEAIMNTTGLQNPTATTDGRLSVQERAPALLHIPSPQVDAGGRSEALPAGKTESGNTRTEDAHVRDQIDHDRQVKMEPLLKMDRESEQWAAATAGIMQEMKKHTEESPILRDLQGQREKLGKAKDSMEYVSRKLERDVEKSFTDLGGLLERMTLFAGQTCGMPSFFDRIHGQLVMPFEFISGIIKDFERLLKRLHADTSKAIKKIKMTQKQLGRGELSLFRLFQGFDNSICNLVRILLGEQESKFISLTTIKKWYCDVDQADACTRVLVPPDSPPAAGEQMVAPITPIPLSSRHASPS